ncbi:MAG TPA: acyl-CoA dehydrogenase family protein [Diaminobutyricibacter sp.]|uniref:acyl-CoA dehydrogenase family protein n=1 Tax=Leifsonia sp. McL0618 TaxID=3415677 RepID=UPI0033881684
MKRDLFTDDHEAYRDAVREFLKREVVPNWERWDDEHMIDRSVYVKAAQTGLYGLQIPEQYGGAGEMDYRYRMVVAEEIAKTGATSFAVTIAVQDDLVLHYLRDLTTDEQRERWLPPFAAGELIGALAMTEPGAGSDLRGIRTRAVQDGDDWILNGQKTFISSGIMADVVIVAAQTNPDAGSRGFTLFVVETGMPGFERGRQLDKIGLMGQDTAELFFRDVRVPAANVLGGVGRGLQNLMSHLPRERLGLTINAFAKARAIFEETRRYCADRVAFGNTLDSLQHVRFELAEMSTELDVAEAYVDKSVLAYNVDELTPTDAGKGKWYLTDLEKRVIDRCLQLHGGYGFMREFHVGRAYIDTRVETIYGGTNEIMKDLIGRELVQELHRHE